jgi:iron complex transport system ATP-binding protein
MIEGPMIEVRDLAVSLGGKSVIEGYNLGVSKGDVLAILGANGIGKTTLLNCIVGLRKPDAGSVAKAGLIGYVPQLFQATFAFSVLDIVLIGRARHLGLFGAPRQADYEIAERYLALMKVDHLSHRRAGIRQRPAPRRGSGARSARRSRRTPSPPAP